MVAFSIKHGCYWRRGRTGAGWNLKFPWAFKFFSERNGIRKPVARFCGLRLFKLEGM